LDIFWTSEFVIMTTRERRRSLSSGSDSDSTSSDEVKDIKPSNDVVLTKYNMAAEIVNIVLKELIEKSKDGQDVCELCDYGDTRLFELTGNLFKKEKNLKKGIGMPTCISIDNCICHFSPLKTEPAVLLKDGQMVKFELGAHVDGYIATVAHTMVIGATKENKITGKKAHVILAAYNAMEMALRMLKPAKRFKNVDITENITKVAKIYETNPVENMLSHQMERFKTVSEKQIIQNPVEEQKSKIEKCSFEDYEVYAVDILISSGEGKPKSHDVRTTIFKKVDEMVYNLKLKASRSFFYDAQKKFGNLPFSLRHFEDEKKAKIGTTECVKHDLLQPYEVVFEKEGEFVAQFKATAIIMPSGILKITGFPLDLDLLQCDVKITDDKISGLLAEGLKPKKKKTGQKDR